MGTGCWIGRKVRKRSKQPASRAVTDGWDVTSVEDEQGGCSRPARLRSCEGQDRIPWYPNIGRADRWTRVVSVRCQNGIRPPLSLPSGIREGGRPERSFYRPGPPGLIPAWLHAEGSKGRWEKWRSDLGSFRGRDGRGGGGRRRELSPNNDKPSMLDGLFDIPFVVVVWNAMSFNGPIYYPPEPLKPETILKSGFIPYGFTSLKEATQKPDFAQHRAGRKRPSLEWPSLTGPIPFRQGEWW
ncbi:hypothetical protein GE21DRAFT_1220921 [Neurospora crassa]|nr:hypothetical protein GE21DRAFT_1220921 [Neurospora crassa]